MEKLHCSVGIAAYNEAANIGAVLDALLHQQLETVELAEIIVISSGSTDETEAIVGRFMAQESRIRLLVQPQREGKISAVNYFIREAAANILVLCSADLRPAPDALEKLVAPMADPENGMGSCRPVPINDPHTFMGFAAHLIWDLHHQINLRSFKAGEMIAFRRLFVRIPYDAVVDEASIEPLIRGQGYRTYYAAEAIVYNKGTETVADYVRQRRRNHAGHLGLKHKSGYTVGTMSGLTILTLLLREMDWRPRQFIWTWLVVGLEVYSRFLGWWDYRQKRDHTLWEMAVSTKQLGERAATDGWSTDREKHG